MATMPQGATLIENVISVAPGFTIGNVHVMAGVPQIMQSMFDALAPRLPGGMPVEMRAVHAAGLLEGDVAERLGGSGALSWRGPRELSLLLRYGKRWRWWQRASARPRWRPRSRKWRR